MNDDAQTLRITAMAAHDRGDHDEAIEIFRKILVLHALSPQAAEAMYYLSTGYRKPAHKVALEQPPALAKNVTS